MKWHEAECLLNGMACSIELSYIVIQDDLKPEKNENPKNAIISPHHIKNNDHTN